jgi:DNA-binding CsgD family transcriptional regulator
MTSIDENRFLDLVYSAPAQPELWVTVMEQLADIIGGSSGWLSALNVVDGGGAGLLMRADPALYKPYFDYYAAINPLNNVKEPTAYFRNWRPKILTDEDWMPKEELVRTEYYNDFMLRGSGVSSTVMIRLAAHDGEVSVINIGRSVARGRFEASELEIVRRFHPHLIRAFKLGENFAKIRVLDQGAGAVFEASPHALFLVNAAGRVIQLNAEAEVIVKARKGLCLVGGRLSAASAEANTRLAGLLAGAMSTGSRRGGSMAIDSPDRVLPLSVTVTPIGEPRLDVFCRERCALVTVTDLEAFTPPPENKLRELFGLTPAEIRLTMTLLKGDALKEAAAELGISANTATVHLSHIFEKTGVNRQSALLSLMMRAVGPGDTL